MYKRRILEEVFNRTVRTKGCRVINHVVFMSIPKSESKMAYGGGLHVFSNDHGRKMVAVLGRRTEPGMESYFDDLLIMPMEIMDTDEVIIRKIDHSNIFQNSPLVTQEQFLGWVIDNSYFLDEIIDDDSLIESLVKKVNDYIQKF